MNDVYRIVKATLRGMWAHRWLGLLTAWLVGVIALGVIAGRQDKYEASARIFANTESILKPLMTGLTVQPNEEQRIVMLSRLLISRPNIERLVKMVGFDTSSKGTDQERLVDDLMRSLEIKAAGRDNVYTLTFRDIDPQRAKRAVDVLAGMFIESSKGGKAEDTDAAKRFIDEQIAIYEKKLQDAENKLKEFRLRYLGLTPGEGKDFFVRMSETNNLLSQARLELREAERARDAFRRGLAIEETAAASGSGPTPGMAQLSEIDARLDAQRRALDTMLQRYTENHPEVVGAKRVIRELEEQRAAQVALNRRSGVSPLAPATTGQRASETLKVSLAQAEAAVASLTSRVAEYSERYNKLKASAALVPQLEAEYAQLNRDYDVNKKNYESLVARRESASISGEMQSVTGVGDFRLVDPPRVSSHPIWPDRRALVAFALLFALAAGLGAAYVANEMRPTFHDARALREASGLPLLGVVSMVMGDPLKRAERWSRIRFTGGLVALFVIFGVGFVALGRLPALTA